eukprot:SAG31_NODE_6263_length_2097_cov_1.129129_2_plen_370_part_00
MSQDASPLSSDRSFDSFLGSSPGFAEEVFRAWEEAENGNCSEKDNAATESDGAALQKPAAQTLGGTASVEDEVEAGHSRSDDRGAISANSIEKERKEKRSATAGRMSSSPPRTPRRTKRLAVDVDDAVLAEQEALDQFISKEWTNRPSLEDPQWLAAENSQNKQRNQSTDFLNSAELIIAAVLQGSRTEGGGQSIAEPSATKVDFEIRQPAIYEGTDHKPGSGCEDVHLDAAAHRLDNISAACEAPGATDLDIRSYIPSESICRHYVDSGIKKLYHWQAEALKIGCMGEGENLIYTAPTSGGKTMVAEVLMLRSVLQSKRKALMVLPYVSIVSEKCQVSSMLATSDPTDAYFARSLKSGLVGDSGYPVC